MYRKYIYTSSPKPHGPANASAYSDMMHIEYSALN